MSTMVEKIKSRVTIKRIGQVAANIGAASFATSYIASTLPVPAILVEYPVLLAAAYIVTDFFTEEYFR